jgi:hypothetical protein
VFEDCNCLCRNGFLYSCRQLRSHDVGQARPVDAPVPIGLEINNNNRLARADHADSQFACNAMLFMLAESSFMSSTYIAFRGRSMRP